MGMTPENYRNIENNYYRLIPNVERMVSNNNPVTFLDDATVILQEVSASSKEIEIGYKNLKDSDNKNKYFEMLSNIQYLQEKLVSRMLKK